MLTHIGCPRELSRCVAFSKTARKARTQWRRRPHNVRSRIRRIDRPTDQSAGPVIVGY